MSGATAGGGGPPTLSAEEWLEAFGRSVDVVSTMHRGIVVVDTATLRILGANRRARDLLCGEARGLDELVAEGRLSRPDAELITCHCGDGHDAPSWSARLRTHWESGSEELVVVGATVIHPALVARVLVLVVGRPGEEDAVADYEVTVGAPTELQFVYDRSLRIVLADPRLRAFGINASSTVGVVTWVMVHPEDIPIAQPRVFDVFAGRADTADYTIRVASPAVGLWTPTRVQLRLLVGAVGGGDGMLVATVEPVGTFKRTIHPGVLSERERAVVVELFHGHRVQQIAARSGVSIKTVRNQLSSIYRKLGVGSQTELLDRFHPPPRAEADAR